MAALPHVTLGQSSARLIASVRRLPETLLIRHVRATALAMLLVVLLLGALSVAMLLYLQPPPPPSVGAPATSLALEKLPPIEQALARLQQAGQAGLAVAERTYFEARPAP